MNARTEYRSEVADYLRAKLDNGMNAIVCQRKHSRTFGWYLSLPVGFRNGKPHLAHLVEHLAMGNLPALNKQLELVNGQTSFQNTEFYAYAHVDSLACGLELLGKILTPLAVDAESVRNETEILRREHAESGAAQYHYWNEYLKALGGDQLFKSYDKAQLNVPKLTADDCNAFHAKYYGLQTATLGLVSPEPIELSLERVQRQLANTQRTDPSEETKDWETQETKRPKRPISFRWMNENFVTCGIWHLLDGPCLTERVCLDLANRAMGRFGDLFETIRSRHRLSYGVYTTELTTEDLVGQQVTVNVRPSRVRKTIRLLEEEFASGAERVDQETFEESKTSYLRGLDFIEDDLWQLPHLLAVWNRFGEGLLTPEHLKNEIKNLTRDDYREKWHRIFHPEHRHVYLGGRYGPMGRYAANKFARGG